MTTSALVRAERLLRTVSVTHPLMSGRNIICPFCERKQDVLKYIVMETSEKYADQVIVPLKCKKCTHVFALRP